MSKKIRHQTLRYFKSDPPYWWYQSKLKKFEMPWDNYLASLWCLYQLLQSFNDENFFERKNQAFKKFRFFDVFIHAVGWSSPNPFSTDIAHARRSVAVILTKLAEVIKFLIFLHFFLLQHRRKSWKVFGKISNELICTSSPVCEDSSQNIF